MNKYNDGTVVYTIGDIEKLTAERDAALDHRNELLYLIYNSAIGQVTMGYSVDADGLAQAAFSITGIDAASIRRGEK